MRLYFTAVDQGDGSLGVEFFESQEAIDYAEEMDPEAYRGEGGQWIDISGEVTASCYGSFKITTMQDLKEQFSEEVE